MSDVYGRAGHDSVASAADAPALRTVGITKRFGPVLANKGIDLSVSRGEVHAVVGENGAGKSTLMSICFGLVQPDSGRIEIDGRPVTVSSPMVARRYGMGMVHQHFKLVPSLTVVDNIFLGDEITVGPGALARRKMLEKVQSVSSRYQLDVPLTAKVKDLPVGVRQRVEILKALTFDARIIILDEPTGVLRPQEAEQLFVTLRSFAAEGRSVIFISHKLGEVRQVADRFTVLRDGVVVSTGDTADFSEAEIARLMVGREVSLARAEPPRELPEAPAALEVEDLVVLDDRGQQSVTGVSLRVKAGEICGIAGVEGNGQTELVEALAGLRATAAGRVRIQGLDVSHDGAAERRTCGLSHIPEDRLAVGIAPRLSIQDNVAAGFFDSAIFPHGLVRRALATSFARALINAFAVRASGPSAAVGQLSGGNVQKVIAARELEARPRVLLAAQPTRGLDIGATEFVHSRLRAAREGGAGVLLVSADLSELLNLSDRVVVMYRGAIAGEFSPEESKIAELGMAMAGVGTGEASSGPARLDGTPDAGQTAATAEAKQTGATAEAGQTAAGVRHHRPPRLASARPKSPEEQARERARWNIPLEVVRGSSGNPVYGPVGLTGRAGTVPDKLAKAARRGAAGMAQPAAAVILALLVGMVLIVGIGQNPLSAYKYFLLSSFNGTNNFGSMVVQLTPLLLVAASVIVSFRAGVFNVGAEGQLYVGAFVGVWVGLTLRSVPGPLLILLSLLAGAVAGALWSVVPAALLAYWDINIIVTTLMFNYLATYLTTYLVQGPFLDTQAGAAETKLVPASDHLPTILGNSGATIGVFIGLLALALVAVLLKWTRWGLQVCLQGDSARFAQYIGVGVKRRTIEVMAVSGAIAGVSGVVSCLSVNFRFFQGFDGSIGYGWLGITVAMLGRLSPLGAVVAGVVYAVLEAGAGIMQVNTSVPLSLINILEGIVVVFMTAAGLLAVLQRRRRGRRGGILEEQQRLAEVGAGEPSALATQFGAGT